jgi:hypothetical protein
LERNLRKFFFVFKSLVPTQSLQDKEIFSCPFQSTDNFPEWKLALLKEDKVFGSGSRCILLLEHENIFYYACIWIWIVYLCTVSQYTLDTGKKKNSSNTL